MKTKLSNKQLKTIDPSNPPLDPKDDAGKVVVLDENGQIPEKMFANFFSNMEYKFVNREDATFDTTRYEHVNIPSGTKAIIVMYRQVGSTTLNQFFTYFLIPGIIESYEKVSISGDTLTLSYRGSNATTSTMNAHILFFKY